MLSYSSQFRGDLKRLRRSGRHKYEELEEVLKYLDKGQPLPARYKDHQLAGEWDDHRECHIKPDWLLVYRPLAKGLIQLVTTGSHADIFG
jgi:mRNA interferase YafQ